MKIKKLTAYLLMSGMILGTMSSDLYTIKAQAVETIEETEDKTPENETPQIPETPEQPETEPENEEVTEAAPVGEIELSAEQFPDQVILTFAGTCDKDGNGSLSEAECMEVEELAMPNAGITDLKGVENFRNLQRVDVSQNAIGDFTPVKDLSSLQILKVNGNPASVLDVTGCSSLKKLYAQNSTFSELHVTGLGSLEEVRIENNHLTDLDLTGLTSLRALSCYGNQLHTLDARPAAALEVLQADSNGMESLLVEGLGNLKTLHCQNNNLQQISLSGLGALEEFNAANNSLRELIVDEATALKTVLAGNNQLSGEFRFGTAKQVSVENNQITNLIGAEENIAYLNFNNNQLTSLKMDSAAPESVYGNGNNLSLLQFGDVSNLKTLYCAENHLAWTESGKALDLQLSPQTIELKRKYDGEKYWTDLNEVLTPQQLQRTEVLMGENSQIASFDKESGKVFYTGPASALEYYFTAGDVGEDEGNARMLVQAKLTEETHVPGAHAIGYANESGYRYARPFIKYTPTWSRSFMPTNQAQREKVARMKLIPVPSLIEDKRLLLIDDSIVRGTQLRETTEFLYNSGAKEVHVRPACPPLLYGCKYLNFSRSKSELDLITRRIILEREGENAEKVLGEYADPNSDRYAAMLEGVRKQQNFTTLRYHRLDDLIASIGLEPCKLCTYCFDGKE